MSMDLLVVGCGLSGAVVARYWADRGKTVVIIERRNHVGGNMFDYVDEHGIVVHKYGPHTFHTAQVRLLGYVSQYAEWDAYHLTCGTEINGTITPTPFNFQTIDDFYSPSHAGRLKARLTRAFAGREFATVREVLRHPDPVIRDYAEFLFEHDYRLYAAKQWGVAPGEIDPGVLDRVPLRFSYGQGYFDDPHEVMPRSGYSNFFRRLLDHPRIEVCLGIEALDHLSVAGAADLLLDSRPFHAPCVYSGPLDELFGYSLGRLPYRSLRFDWRWESTPSRQPYPVVAYPEADGYTRITEYNKLPVQRGHGTSYAIEYPLPCDSTLGNEPYYPILTQASQALRSAYSQLAAGIGNLYPCGRLADFRYYNMDQALDNALSVAATLQFPQE